MKTLKKLAVIMLSVMVLFGTMTVPASAAAKTSPKKQTLAAASLKKTSFTYNRKRQVGELNRVKGSNGKYLKKGVDYKVVYPKKSTNAGTYTVIIKGLGKYAGQTLKKTYTIKKAPAKKNIVTVWTKSVSVKKAQVAKKNYNTNIKFARMAGGSKWVSSNPKVVKVNNAGKITVVKGAKKGTYKVTLVVTARNYKQVKKVVKVVVK